MLTEAQLAAMRARGTWMGPLMTEAVIDMIKIALDDTVGTGTEPQANESEPKK